MRHLEDGLQSAVADYLDLRGWLWNHYPAGGKRNAREAARLKGMGVKSGVPDVMIKEPWRTKDFSGYGVAIELKIGKNTCTDNQREWLRRLNKRGWLTVVCFTIDEAIEVCEVIG